MSKEPEFTESFKRLRKGRVIYRRTMPLIGSRSEVCIVDIPLTKHFIDCTDGEALAVYLDRAVAAVLTRNGVREV